MKKNHYSMVSMLLRVWKCKTLLVMRLTLLICLFFAFQSIAIEVLSQNKRLSINQKSIKIEEIIQLIENKTDYYFMYSAKTIDVQRTVDIEATDKLITEILDDIFKGTNVSYKINGRLIALSKNGEESAHGQQSHSVFGKVVDTTGAPLPGVSVVVKGTTTGVITDMDGKYALAKVPENATLQFSFVGMKTQEINVKGKSNISVTMIEESVGIEEVVAIGYGTQKKVNLTGAVQQVIAKDLEDKSVANMGQALQGMVPNLNVSINNGNPATNATYNIRGGTSFSQTGDEFLTGAPLILVDGIAMDINRLIPEDIESISVIKDASASAIYGARGTYGVILVTTKKGKKDSTPEISFSSSFHLQLPNSDPGILNSVEYQQAYMNAITLNGGVPTSDDEYKLKMIKNYFNDPINTPSYYMSGNTIEWVANTNPWKELLKKSAPMTNYVLSLSGGSSKSSYYASLGYKDQNGIIDVNEDSKKSYNAMFGISADITDWLNIDLKTIYNQYNTEIPYGGPEYPESSIFNRIFQYGVKNILRPLYTSADSPVGIMLVDNHVNYIQHTGNILTRSEVYVFKTK